MATGKMSLFADKLRKMQGEVENFMAGYTPGMDKVPDGIYIARQACELAESSSSGKLMIKRKFVISDGEYTGKSAFDNIVFEGNEIGAQILRRWIELHGCQWPEGDLSTIEPITNRINELNCLVKIRVKTTISTSNDQEYTNIQVMKLLEEAELDFSDIMGGKPIEPERLPAAKAPAAKAPAAKAPAAKAPAAKAPAKAPAKQEEPEEPAEEVISDDLTKLSRVQLKKLIACNVELEDIKVTIKWTDDDIRDAIRKAREAAAQDAAEESETQDTTDEIDTTEVLAFCASQGIDEVTDEMSIDEIKEVMAGYGYQANELTDEEVALLEKLELSENIQKPAPKAKARKV